MPPSGSSARARLALTASFGLLIAGCAGQPLPPPGPAPARHGRDDAPTSSPVSPNRQVARAAQAKDVTTSSEDTPDYVPHKWRDPEKDLWSDIRAGFALDPESQRVEVRQWTQYYATHGRHLDTSLTRARPFLWHVVKQIEARDLPTELALLPIVESGYDASARSYVGASGLWQFMPGTADHMGLSRDWWYDGRNDVIASTNAALDYLELLDKRYGGNWLLALAAYNAGPGRVDAALASAESEGTDTSYWNLDLPQETTDYVPKLLAVRRILMTPARFGIDWPSLDNTPRTKAVTLPCQVELAVAARMLDMSEADLRKLNPGMRRWASGPDGSYTLLVPATRAAAFKARLAAADPASLIHRRTHVVRRGEVLGRIAEHYRVSVSSLRQANRIHGDRIIVGQKLQIPRPGVAPPAEPTQNYVVQSGDTLWDIARRYNVDVASLRRANGRASTTLHPGQSLILPGAAGPPEPTTYVVHSGDSLWSIAHTNDIAVADLKRWNRLGRDTALQPGRELAVDGPAPLPDFYEVEAGDSLWSIANRFSMQVTTLRSLNDMASGSTIRPGQRLRLQPAVSS